MNRAEVDEAGLRGWLDFTADELRVAVDRSLMAGVEIDPKWSLVQLWAAVLPALLEVRDQRIIAEWRALERSRARSEKNDKG